MYKLYLFLLVGPALAAQTGNVPLYRAGRTLDPIKIDGKLDEFTWAALPRVGPFREIHNPDVKPKFPTESAVAWDNVNLYVAFTCRDSDPWSRMKNRDDHLWEEEVVEVFLDPDGDGQNYAELEVSPNNVVVDLLIPRPGSGAETAIKWDIAGLRTAVDRHKAGWIAEIAIPWKSLAAAGVSAAPTPGARWRVGLYRIKRPGGPNKADQITRVLQELKSASAAQKAGLEEKLRELRANDEF